MKCAMCCQDLTMRGDVVITFIVGTTEFTANICGGCMRGFVQSKPFYALQAAVIKQGWVQESLPF